MLKLRDIMTSDVLTVTPETTLREAMELLSSRHVSGAPVVCGGRVVGIVSGTDLMAMAAQLSGVPSSREVHDEWGEFAESSVEDEVALENEPGSVSFTELWDDAGADTLARMEVSGSPEWNVLEEHVVSEVMTPVAVDVPPPNGQRRVRRRAHANAGNSPRARHGPRRAPRHRECAGRRERGRGPSLHDPYIRLRSRCLSVLPQQGPGRHEAESLT